MKITLALIKEDTDTPLLLGLRHYPPGHSLGVCIGSELPRRSPAVKQKDSGLVAEKALPREQEVEVRGEPPAVRDVRLRPDHRCCPRPQHQFRSAGLRRRGEPVGLYLCRGRLTAARPLGSGAALLRCDCVLARSGAAYDPRLGGKHSVPGILSLIDLARCSSRQCRNVLRLSVSC